MANVKIPDDDDNDDADAGVTTIARCFFETDELKMIFTEASKVVKKREWVKMNYRILVSNYV